MAITNIGTAVDTPGPTVVITVGVGGVPAGSLIFVCAYELTPAGTASSFSDTKGNTYHSPAGLVKQDGTPNGFERCGYVFNSIALVSGDKITYTKDAANPTAFSACYATGIQTSPDPLDTAVTASSVTNSVTSGTPGQSGELFFGSLGFNFQSGDSNPTQAPGWAAPPNAINDGANVAIFAGDLINAGTGTKTYNPSDPGRSEANIICAFKVVAAATHLQSQICLG